MKKTAVIFDMDGLMFDTQSIYDNAYDDIARAQYGFEVPPEMHLALMGSSGEDIVRAAARFLPEEVDARKFIRQSFDRVAELVKTKLPARPGRHPALSQGKRLYSGSCQRFGTPRRRQ